MKSGFKKFLYYIILTLVFTIINVLIRVVIEGYLVNTLQLKYKDTVNIVLICYGCVLVGTLAVGVLEFFQKKLK